MTDKERARLLLRALEIKAELKKIDRQLKRYKEGRRSRGSNPG